MDLDRDELYEEVWKTPVFRLSRKYGISDRGLAKICKRMKHPRSAKRILGKTCGGTKGKTEAAPAA